MKIMPFHREEKGSSGRVLLDIFVHEHDRKWE
jgi:hypothetical protein